MNRKDFIINLGLTSAAIPMVTSLNSLEKLSSTFKSTKRMPVFFLGHGSPMNGIEDNQFVQGFKKQGELLEKPNAIVVISAHWETKGTKVTAMEFPKTIHDFGGFPKALYEVQYPAPGHPELAKEISTIVQPEDTVHLDHQWGLDHGAWTVVKHMFPKADVPVIQLSLDYTLNGQQHFDLAQQLNRLRDKGVLIVGSGNMVHNLRRLEWSKINDNYGYDWAIEANTKMKEWILSSNHKQLIDFKNQAQAFNLAIPTPEHYLPLIYVLAMSDNKDEKLLFNDQYSGGSLSMTSVKFG
ncbi:4,5-DOPA dioxygenase extradiol [Mesoflavibacter sp. SCSIO 43206]|uniref:4,5-DOPA-extradiol-dioxygenase n=1 Tax=Mesoflavibacter sp. SCSIO 43206 TaxID=2779362 RepID=UPI001CAA2943|nr:4,5-DOPA dioxygenase extradiol [Mesoflavibacter sp. SCSIO 43206]UAB74850.1 4,5-DOPA dioxygenase extradiol [Mesoflavibacter sp. SCSIO 43206]